MVAVFHRLSRMVKPFHHLPSFPTKSVHDFCWGRGDSRLFSRYIHLREEKEDKLVTFAVGKVLLKNSHIFWS